MGKRRVHAITSDRRSFTRLVADLAARYGCPADAGAVLVAAREEHAKLERTERELSELRGHLRAMLGAATGAP